MLREQYEELRQEFSDTATLGDDEDEETPTNSPDTE